MPIANCIISSDCKINVNNSTCLIDSWSKLSGKNAQQMTVNIIRSEEQQGKKYQIMANLILPSLWPENDIATLQLCLAQALAQHYDIPLSEVFVATHVVHSGRVIDAGEVLSW